MDALQQFIARRDRSAYTLIELLVVIAIVAILAAIVIPVVSNIRKNANDVQAANNIRQLAIAQMQYANEHNGELTAIWNYAGDLPQRTWQIRLVPYLYPNVETNAQLTSLRLSTDSVFDMPEANRGTMTAPLKSVGMNSRIATQYGPGMYPLHAASRPDSIIMLGEMEEKNSDTMIPHDLSSGIGTPGTPGFNRVGDKAIMAFCDGRVEAMDPTELTFSDKTKNTNPWTWK